MDDSPVLIGPWTRRRPPRRRDESTRESELSRVREENERDLEELRRLAGELGGRVPGEGPLRA